MGKNLSDKVDRVTKHNLEIEASKWSQKEQEAYQQTQERDFMDLQNGLDEMMNRTEEL